MSINSWTWHNIYSEKVAKVKGSLAIYTVVQVPSESNNTLLLVYSLSTKVILMHRLHADSCIVTVSSYYYLHFGNKVAILYYVVCEKFTCWFYNFKFSKCNFFCNINVRKHTLLPKWRSRKNYCQHEGTYHNNARVSQHATYPLKWLY